MPQPLRQPTNGRQQSAAGLAKGACRPTVCSRLDDQGHAKGGMHHFQPYLEAAQLGLVTPKLAECCSCGAARTGALVQHACRLPSIHLQPEVVIRYGVEWLLVALLAGRGPQEPVCEI